jgi:hypothetical protein
LHSEQSSTRKRVAWVRATAPGSVRQILAWIAPEYGVDHESRSWLVALRRPIGLVYRKPEITFVAASKRTGNACAWVCAEFLSSLGPHEAVVAADAGRTPRMPHARRDAGPPKMRSRLTEHTASQPQCEVLGANARASHPQQTLSNPSRLRRRKIRFPTQPSPKGMGGILRFGIRHLLSHRPRQFSHGRSNAAFSRRFFGKAKLVTKVFGDYICGATKA